MMRMFEDDEGHQIFDACVFLTQNEATNLIGFLEDCLQEDIGYYLHIFDEQEPDRTWKTRQLREITATSYESSNFKDHTWEWYTKLIEDDSGMLEIVDFRSTG